MSQLWMARPSKRAVTGKRSLGRVSCLPSTAKHRAAPTGGLLGRATRRFSRFAALGWLVALVLAPVSACSGTDDASTPPTVELDAQATDAAQDDAGEGAEVDANGAADATTADSTDATNATDASQSFLSNEEACLRLHGCLGVSGMRQCMLYARANQVATEEELQFGVAMQSIALAGSPPPSTPTTLYLPSVMSCVRAAADCAAARACVGDGAPCNPQTFAPSCDGQLLRQCVPSAEGGVVATTDCAEVGLVCLAGATPMGALAQCAASASEMGTPPSCDGDRASNCILGGWIHQPCSSMPATQCALVEAMGMDAAQCQGDGADCDLSQLPTCEGDDVRICQGNKLYTMACPPGGACGTDPESGAGSCWASTLFCGPETCEGTRLGYCLEGQQRSIDCADYGFSGCAASGDAGARCVL